MSQNAQKNIIHRNNIFIKIKVSYRNDEVLAGVIRLFFVKQKKGDFGSAFLIFLNV